jgi:leucine dehydrogenase
VSITERSIGRIERVIWARIPEAGLAAVVAVHAPRLGKALAGCTVAGPVDSAAATVRAMRHAESTTLAARTAGLAAGGGAIIMLGEPGPDAYAALGGLLDRLDGGLWLVPDLGDAAAAQAVVPHTRYAADPDPAEVAAGLVSVARGAWRQATGEADLLGLRIAVLADGLLPDHVAELLTGDGAVVQRAASALDLHRHTDMVVSCAPSALTDEQAVDLRCRVAIGAPGDALDSDAVWAALAARGVLAIPGAVAGGALLSAAEALTRETRPAVRAA